MKKQFDNLRKKKIKTEMKTSKVTFYETGFL